MSFRTLVITKKARLSYSNNYIIIRNEDMMKVHLDEVGIVIIDSLQVSLTTYLIMELSKRNIKVIYCDEKHNPVSELVPYYGNHNTSKKIKLQSEWSSTKKDQVWKNIIKQKIYNQSQILKYNNQVAEEQLKYYVSEVVSGDDTNREGHAAKVYFNALFGMDFTRRINNDINAALDYGYSILLSSFNKEIVRLGHVTQLGIHHKNEFNPYNLSSDLMEPFRPVIDGFVLSYDESFDSAYKYKLVGLLNEKHQFENKSFYLKDIIRIYTKKTLDSLNDSDLRQIPEFLL